MKTIPSEFHYSDKTPHFNGIVIANMCELIARPQGYKTFFMLNSAEYEIYQAHKC